MKNRVVSKISDILGMPDFVLEKPKDPNLGHYATPVAFSLSKVLKKSPVKIAEELSLMFVAEPMFKNVNAVNGYINFTLSNKFLDESLKESLKCGFYTTCNKSRGTILLEYVSANPTGPLHIGHARGAVVGDTLSRVGRFIGYDVSTEYYINDAGNQIDLLGLSIYLSGRESVLNLNVDWPEQYYKGEYVTDLAHEACNEFGESIFMEESSIQKLSLWGKNKMLDLIKSNLYDIGIEFDYFVSENSLYNLWDKTLELLVKSGKTYNFDGKVWIASSEYGDEKDRVIVREDGRPTYLAGDIIYHNNKFARNFDYYINIWGADHHGYISRVKAAINFLGYDDKKLEVILAQMVSLLKGGEPYKMSKRAGNFILMSDVVEEIGQDALRFMFLSKKSDTHLDFDVELLKKQDSSNPVYYINYAHARINQLFENSKISNDDFLDVSLINMNESSSYLLFQALLLPEVLEDAFNSRNIQKIPDYLKMLASTFHRFYSENKIIGSENERVYLKIFSLVALSIKVGLSLMGIEAKKRM